MDKASFYSQSQDYNTVKSRMEFKTSLRYCISHDKVGKNVQELEKPFNKIMMDLFPTLFQLVLVFLLTK